MKLAAMKFTWMKWIRPGVTSLRVRFHMIGVAQQSEHHAVSILLTTFISSQKVVVGGLDRRPTACGQWRVLRFFIEGGDFGNPTGTEGVWAYGIILCICE